MILVCVLFLIIIQPAHAYLDPGSGSMLISVIIALLATLYYFAKNIFYNKSKYFFKKNSSIQTEKNDIVFYSESGCYWNVFFPIIRELSERGITSSYYTSDKKDPGLSTDIPELDKKYIGDGYEAFFFLNHLETCIVVMTTPGLDVLQIKRSKKVKHYCHIVHGLEDTSTYSPYGVDYFDSVLVNGEHQVFVIRELEKERSLPEKKVEIIGSTYLDVMRENINKKVPDNLNILPDKKTVLLAPSWGEKGFLKNHAESILNSLIEEDYNIILRPHPQSLKAEADVIKLLENKFADKKYLIWDKTSSGLEAMRKSDVMISDFSGIIFDYIFLFSKPVIVTDFKLDCRKYDMNILKSKSSTLMKLINEDKIGYRFKSRDYKNIKKIVQIALSDNPYKQYVDEIKDTVNCFPGQAGKRGADFLQSELKKIVTDKNKGTR